MRSAKRGPQPAVIERLCREPWRFEFFQAVRLLETWLRRRGQPGDDLVARHLRFQNSTSLRFPPSQLEAVQPEPRDIQPQAAALAAALEDGSLRHIRITPAFMGLLGGNGVLPAHYTERLAEHQASDKDKDEGPRAFLDTFSNRSLALFYAAWRKYRLAQQYQLDGRDAFLPGGMAVRALKSLLSMFTGVSLAYEIELELRALDVRSAALHETGPAVRLGWDSFLVEGAQTANRRDVRYGLHVL